MEGCEKMDYDFSKISTDELRKANSYFIEIGYNGCYGIKCVICPFFNEYFCENGQKLYELFGAELDRRDHPYTCEDINSLIKEESSGTETRIQRHYIRHEC
jgi:hypothetical protein